jgi:hypothetical protein
MSLTMTAMRRPCSLLRMCWRRVVFPLPWEVISTNLGEEYLGHTRKPDRSVTGRTFSGTSKPLATRCLTGEVECGILLCKDGRSQKFKSERGYQKSRECRVRGGEQRPAGLEPPFIPTQPPYQYFPDLCILASLAPYNVPSSHHFCPFLPSSCCRGTSRGVPSRSPACDAASIKVRDPE